MTLEKNSDLARLFSTCVPSSVLNEGFVLLLFSLAVVLSDAREAMSGNIWASQVRRKPKYF